MKEEIKGFRRIQVKMFKILPKVEFKLFFKLPKVFDVILYCDNEMGRNREDITTS